MADMASSLGGSGKEGVRVHGDYGCGLVLSLLTYSGAPVVES